jgi:hypothetical protein
MVYMALGENIQARLHNSWYNIFDQTAVLGSGQEKRDDVVMGYERPCLRTP